MKSILLIIITLFSLSSFGTDTFFCKEELSTLPIQQNGRVKPFLVHAGEMIKELTGKSKTEEYSATMAYCLLSISSMQLPLNITLNAHIDHVKLQKFFNLKDEKLLSYETLLPQFDAIRTEMMSVKDDESYKKSLGKLLNQIRLYQDIKNGENWTLAELSNQKVTWVPLPAYLTEEKVLSFKNSQSSDAVFEALMNSKKVFDQNEKNSKYQIEYTYARLHLPSYALLFTLLAIGSLVITNKFIITLSLSGISLILQTALIVFRILISGRAPITNMYETVLFSGYGALFLSMVLGHLKKENIYVYMGLMYNLCTLMMINFANGMLTPTISPLVPVLRDNFWLSTHVTSLILSYGALALSWILSNTILIKKRFLKIDDKEERRLSDIIYTTLKWGTTLLALGIILGGVWADYSWGRFWGWDPKETWSLIVLCLYMAILHGRYTSWIKTHHFVTYTALAFLSVMMAWFGVNYILASGLHSYGFSEGGALFLATFFITQIVIVVMTFQKTKEN